MRVLSESELILNNDGSIYHLCLSPGELAPNIITVGDPDRVRTVSRFFDKIDVKKSNREFITHTGLYKGKPVSVVSTGIGTDNIDIVMTELDALVNIDIGNRTLKKDKTRLNIIRIGTSGSLQASIGLNTVVASAYGMGFDNLMQYYKFENNSVDCALLRRINNDLNSKKNGLYPYLAPASKTLLKRVASDYVKGITVTCSGFYGPQGRHLRLKPAHPDLLDKLSSYKPNSKGLHITNLEMETAGILGMAKLLGHRALSLNIIVANRVTQSFSANYSKVLDDTVVSVLEKI